MEGGGEWREEENEGWKMGGRRMGKVGSREEEGEGRRVVDRGERWEEREGGGGWKRNEKEERGGRRVEDGFYA